MHSAKDILTQSESALRERTKRKIIGKINEISGASFGEALYFRPYREDERLIVEIAKETGEKKNVVAQKLLHLVLRVIPDESARETRRTELVEWLVTNEKHKAARSETAEARLERLEEHARELENALETINAHSRFTRVMLSEIYCLGCVCMSYLNQIFTKLIEYFSPNEIEKKNSADFANRNVLGLVEHSLAELEKLSLHHELDLESVEPEMLYLFTKIETIKARLLPPPQKGSTSPSE